MPEPAERVVHVEIFGQQYAVRTPLEPSYVQDLASYVDAKMRAASDATPNSDVLRLAVLTALNVADELFRYADTERRRTAQVSERAAALEQLLDQALR
ncbi:MAG: cell division protein ZapA [Bacteroidales bacterium]